MFVVFIMTRFGDACVFDEYATEEEALAVTEELIADGEDAWFCGD